MIFKPTRFDVEFYLIEAITSRLFYRLRDRDYSIVASNPDKLSEEAIRCLDPQAGFFMTKPDRFQVLLNTSPNKVLDILFILSLGSFDQSIDRIKPAPNSTNFFVR